MKIHLFVLGLLFVVKADMHAYVQLGNEDGTPPEEPEYLKDIPIDYVTFDLSLPKIRGENDKSLTNEMFDHIMKTLNDPDFDVTELPIEENGVEFAQQHFKEACKLDDSWSWKETHYTGTQTVKGVNVLIIAELESNGKTQKYHMTAHTEEYVKEKKEHVYSLTDCHVHVEEEKKKTDL